MYPLSGENGLVTKPFLPGTGIPYRKSSPFLELARVAVRVLLSLGGLLLPTASVGVALASAVPLFDFCLLACERLCCCGSVKARLIERKNFSNGPDSDSARRPLAPTSRIDIIASPVCLFPF